MCIMHYLQYYGPILAYISLPARCPRLGSVDCVISSLLMIILTMASPLDKGLNVDGELRLTITKIVETIED